MTAAERQALALLVDAQVREREEQRRADRQLTRALIAPNPKRRRRRTQRRCVYCGTPSFGRACAPHRDLIQLEAVA